MKSFVIFATTILLVLVTSPQIGAEEIEKPSTDPRPLWSVDAEQSRLEFSATQNGKAFKGEFTDFEAKIVFDPEDLPSSSIDVFVDMTSAETGDRQRDDAFPSGDWFKTKEFPKAHFSASDIVATDNGYYEAKGTLTIRDVKRELVLPFSLEIDGPSARAEGKITIVRTDFGVGQGVFSEGKWVGLDVSVGFVILANK